MVEIYSVFCMIEYMKVTTLNRYDLPSMVDINNKKFNIQICPKCNDRFVPTKVSPSKCLFCKRNNYSSRRDYYTIPKQSILAIQ